MTVSDVIVAWLQTGGLTVFTTPPASTASYPYVVCYFDAGRKSSDRAADVRVSRSWGWQTTTVGVSAAQCSAARERVVSALGDWRPTATGLAFSKVAHEVGDNPVTPDEDLPDRTLFIATDLWRVVSDPA